MMFTVRSVLSSIIMALRKRVPTMSMPQRIQIAMSGSKPPQMTRPTSAGGRFAKTDGPP